MAPAKRPSAPFHETMKALRVEAGLTQLQVAVLLEVALMTVSKWERGLTAPTSLEQEAIIARLKKAAPKA